MNQFHFIGKNFSRSVTFYYVHVYVYLTIFYSPYLYPIGYIHPIIDHILSYHFIFNIHFILLTMIDQQLVNGVLPPKATVHLPGNIVARCTHSVSRRGWGLPECIQTSKVSFYDLCISATVCDGS